nr:MAG TPA: tail completion protein [Caudoviricetes sp.]
MSWKDIYKHLRDHGHDVYSLGQHQGDCKDPYLVLRDNGRAGPSYSLEAHEYEVLLYYPYNRYSEFGGYIDEVRKCMNELFPAVKYVGPEQPHYPDDDVKGYMTSLIYQVTEIVTINKVI